MRHVQRLLTLLFEPHTIYQNRDQTPPCVVHTHNMSSAKVKITQQNPIEHSPDPNIKAKVNATSRTATTTTTKPSAAHSKYGCRLVGHEVYMYIWMMMMMACDANDACSARAQLNMKNCQSKTCDVARHGLLYTSPISPILSLHHIKKSVTLLASAHKSQYIHI